MESLSSTINIEYDEDYNPCHKTISISSMESAPSFYTGKADSCSSLCDPDEIREPLFFDDPNPYEFLKMKQRSSISIPFEDLDPYSLQSFIIPANNDKQIQESIPFELNNDQKKSNSKDDLNSYSDEFNYSTTCENKNKNKNHHDQLMTEKQVQTSSEEVVEPSSATLKVLSQDEKRANHIASEQKRRQNIRNGFKQLSDIIPTLKNMPNSKSTILFKAADYIKHNEKRNKILQDRLKHLQRKLVLSTTISQQYPSTNTTMNHSSSTSSNHHINHNLYHSTQEKIRLLQQQLLRQHQLLLKHNIISNHTQYFQPPSTTKSSSSSTSAIVMPVQPDDDDHHQTSTFNSTPCLHIPADEDYCQESIHRERLLSCGKLNFN
ncbi:unnamed protein product [Cunninghamella blakesleeana]